MREIKFRAWNKLNCKMSSTFTLEELFVDGHEMLTFLPKELRPKIISKTMTFMQCTGLPDKNGKEIYEGDILKFVYHYDKGQWSDYKSFTEVVRWNELYCGFRPICGTGEYNMPRRYYEVIGNIYENPELLETSNVRQ